MDVGVRVRCLESDRVAMAFVADDNIDIVSVERLNDGVERRVVRLKDSRRRAFIDDDPYPAVTRQIRARVGGVQRDPFAFEVGQNSLGVERLGHRPVRRGNKE